MIAIILAAGMGTRLHSVTNGLPKSLLKINDKTILERQILACTRIGIKEFVIVVGFKKEKLMKECEKFSELIFHFVENPIYDRTNTLYSLWLARKFFNDDFIYFNADVIFDLALLNYLAEKKADASLLIDYSQCAEEEVKVVLENNLVKEIGKKIDPEICAGEFIGIGRFNKSLQPKFIEALRYGVENNESNNYFEYAVNLLCSQFELLPLNIKPFKALEIDFPEDYEKVVVQFK